MDIQYYGTPNFTKLYANTYNPLFDLPDTWLPSPPHPGDSPSSKFTAQFDLCYIITQQTPKPCRGLSTYRATSYIAHWARLACSDAERGGLWPVLPDYEGMLEGLFGLVGMEWGEALRELRGVCPRAEERLLGKLWMHLWVVREVNMYRYWSGLYNRAIRGGRVDVALHKVYRDFEGEAFIKPPYPRGQYEKGQGPTCYSWYAPPYTITNDEMAAKAFRYSPSLGPANVISTPLTNFVHPEGIFYRARQPNPDKDGIARPLGKIYISTPSPGAETTSSDDYDMSDTDDVEVKSEEEDEDEDGEYSEEEDDNSTYPESEDENTPILPVPAAVSAPEEDEWSWVGPALEGFLGLEDAEDEDVVARMAERGEWTDVDMEYKTPVVEDEEDWTFL